MNDYQRLSEYAVNNLPELHSDACVARHLKARHKELRESLRDVHSDIEMASIVNELKDIRELREIQEQFSETGFGGC